VATCSGVTIPPFAPINIRCAILERPTSNGENSRSTCGAPIRLRLGVS
jgi:hypothetical protein